MAAIGRNEPCPCGSGRKYKQCCLKTAQAQAAGDRAATREQQARTLHEADLVQRIDAWATARGIEGWETPPYPALPGDPHQHILPMWKVFMDGPSPEATWRAAFMADEAATLTEVDRAALAAQAETWLGVWEVVDQPTPATMRVVDRLTGAEREVLATPPVDVLRPGDQLVARLVAEGGPDRISGFFPKAFARGDGAALVERVRAAVAETGQAVGDVLTPDQLRRPDVARATLVAADVCADAAEAAAWQQPDTGGVKFSPPPPGMLPALQARVAQAYLAWATEPDADLGNRTPRAALALPTGPACVERLIRRMARQDRLNPEHLQFDFNRLREKLGLPLA
ncbi:MAG: SEC-C domain-containing protein [Myxococcales bacterium]|nr:SEC-C domain-containing protein [Myxococcales bacterium]